MSGQCQMGSVSVLLILSLGAVLAGCATPASRHPVTVSDMGTASRTSELEASLVRPGIVTFERLRFAQWTGGRGTFIDRKDARTDSVPKGNEEAVIYAYVVDHPRFGRVMIDSGMSADLGERLNGLMRRAVSDLDIRIERTTA